MAHSPNCLPTLVNAYFINGPDVPNGFSCGYGPPIAWVINVGYRWPNDGTGKVGSGVLLSTNIHHIPGEYLAHEFGHSFSLCSIVRSGKNRGKVLQWHSIGDVAGPEPIHGDASRDDIVSRRRVMYPFNLQDSNYGWRKNMGYGHMGRDVT